MDAISLKEHQGPAMVALLGILGDAYLPCDNEHRHQNVVQE